MEKKIIITGSLAFDYIMDFPGRFSDHILPEKIHEINLSFLVKNLKRQFGGTAGNIAYNLALLGFKPIILATAGQDFTDYQKELEKTGIETSRIKIIKKEKTASAYIITDMADNQIIGFYPGAMKDAKNLKLKTQKLKINKKINKEDFVVISPNEPKAMVNYVKESQSLGLDYLFDPGMQIPRLSNSDLELGIKRARIIIGNDYEMALINSRLKTKKQKPKFNSQIWITTLGEKGSIIEVNGKTYKIPPAKPKQILDPTGAGDAYRAGFLAGFLCGLDLETCGKMGSVTAIYTVEKYGTQTHRFSIKEFCQRYQENFKENLKLPRV